MNEKHWYYAHEVPNKFGNVWTACKKNVLAKTQTDLFEPTCEICKKAKEEDDNWKNSIDI